MSLGERARRGGGVRRLRVPETRPLARARQLTGVVQMLALAYRRGRQMQPEDRATVRGILGGDRAAVLRGDLAYDRQAEAAALGAARVCPAVEAVEHVG